VQFALAWDNHDEGSAPPISEAQRDAAGSLANRLKEREAVLVDVVAFGDCIDAATAPALEKLETLASAITNHSAKSIGTASGEKIEGAIEKSNEAMTAARSAVDAITAGCPAPTAEQRSALGAQSLRDIGKVPNVNVVGLQRRSVQFEKQVAECVKGIQALKDEIPPLELDPKKYIRDKSPNLATRDQKDLVADSGAIADWADGLKKRLKTKRMSRCGVGLSRAGTTCASKARWREEPRLPCQGRRSAPQQPPAAPQTEPSAKRPEMAQAAGISR